MSELICTPGLTIVHSASADALFHAHENASKVILLTSLALDKADIFRNGLYQNIFILYNMFAALGYKPIMLVEKTIESTGAVELFNGYRAIALSAFIAKPFYVYTIIEVALGLPVQLRDQFRSIGARTCKLYLGNIINIDSEMLTTITGQTINHHMAGSLDAVWTSPHYAPNVEYASVINSDIYGVAPPARVVPYVWSPMFIPADASRYITVPTGTIGRGFTIIEPNISFQKCSLIPLMILENIYRKCPELVSEVIIINGDKLLTSVYFETVICAGLHLVRDGRVRFLPRKTILEITREWPSNIVVANQILNEYNYIMMELLHLGFPYVHNCASLADYGYYYAGSDIDAGTTAAERAASTHDQRTEAVRAEAAQLTWKFSPYNPEILREWACILQIQK